MSMPPPHGAGLPMPVGMMPGMPPMGYPPMGMPMPGTPEANAFFASQMPGGGIGMPPMGGDPFMGMGCPGIMPPMGPPQPGPSKADAELGMQDAAEMLHNAAMVIKRRRCLVAVDEVPGFVRTVYTLLRVCDPDIIGWNEKGTQIVIKESERFAAEICPKFFRHRNFNSFTRLLNMYQFHKVPSVSRDSKDVCFEHPHFQRGRNDLLPLVQRKGAQTMRDEMIARELWERTALGRAPPGHAATLEASLAPIHGAGAPHGLSPDAEHHPGHWMRRMADLEAVVKDLKAENETLKALEAERESLKAQVATQENLITVLQAAQAPFNPAPMPAFPGMPAFDASGAPPTADGAPPMTLDGLPPGMPPPPPELQEAFSQMGGPMMMMMSMMTGAMQQGIAAAADAPAPAPAENALDFDEVAAEVAPPPAKRARSE